MIAEIRHKVISSQEDELTGNFFGNMRYLPYSRGLKKILDAYAESPKDPEFLKILTGLDAEEFSFDFWVKAQKDGTEIDCLMKLMDTAVGIEVKLYSGLSGDDQIQREVGLLNELCRKDQKLLLFVAFRSALQEVYDANYKEAMENGVHLGYIAWEDILQGLSYVETTSPFEDLIISDLKALLKEKGFDMFRNFETTVEVEGDLFYDFR